MARVGVFYGSTTGNTLKVAEMIQEAFGADEADLFDVRQAPAETLSNYDVLILGTSTWHWGGLQDEWADFEQNLTRADLKGKKVALFGLGDQKRYPDNFVDGIGLLYDRIKPLGIELVGMWPTQGYDFDKSAGQVDDQFVGLAIDEDNEPDKTEPRVKQWVSQLKQELSWAKSE
jgi:flavodoxin I